MIPHGLRPLGMPFQPQPENQVLWLDAQRKASFIKRGGGQPSNGDPIQTWADLSQNAYALFENVNAQQPTYDASGVHPLVSFSAGQDLQSNVQLVLGGTKTLTVYWVGGGDNVTTAEVFEYGPSVTTVGGSFNMLVDTGHVNFTSNGSTSLVQSITTASGFTSGLHVISCVYDVTNAAFPQAIPTYDGAPLAVSQFGSASAGSFSDLFLYLASRAATSLRWTGKMGEMLIYNTAHSATVQSEYIRYLRLKWGTP